jgi:uncharacterized protein YbjT (DUF2867 family)
MTILITGATGNVGRHLVGQLLAAGYGVRALTRNAAKANLPGGAEVVEGDLTKPETLAGALEGVEGLHLINFGGDDYAPLQTGSQLMALAERAGVKRVTVLLGGEKGALEEAVEASSPAWTFLQPVEFMSGVLDFAEAIRAGEVVQVPFASRRSAMVHDADIASVAAVALTQDGHGGQTYPITGGEVLTPREMIRTIGEVLGRTIEIKELDEAAAIAHWRAAGMSEEVIEFMCWVYGNTPPIGYTVVPTVQQVTGRPPRTLKQWVEENVEKFRQ